MDATKTDYVLNVASRKRSTDTRQDREAHRAASPEDPTTPPPNQDPKLENDKLASFFAGLINKNAGSPRS
jgi:hypothetical protein